MIEEKLKMAAKSLPEPKSGFLAVEEAYKKKPSVRPVRRKRRLAIILTILLLLTGCATVAVTTEVNHSAWVDPIVRPWSTAKRELKAFNYTLPKKIGDSAFSQTEHMYFCPPGTSWLGAILKPSYKPTIVTYGDSRPNAGVAKTPEMELMFGSTENRYCHQWWSLEEDYEPWFMRKDNLLEGTGERLEYEDNILYTGTLVYPWEQTTYDAEGNPIRETGETHRHHVLWVDTERNLACCLDSADVDLETLLGYVKDIIDLNNES